MSSNYLNKYRSNLPIAQGNQILKLLTTQRDSGQIRTLDEFKNQLKALTSQLLNAQLSPTLKLYNAIPGQDISPDTYNWMLDRIEDDLSAVFSELNNLGQLIDTHHNLIDNVALKALRDGINELDQQIRLYEFIQKDGRGFDSSLFNTFNAAQIIKTPRSDVAAAFVYTDPRVNDLVPIEEDAHVDSVGEKLVSSLTFPSSSIIKSATWLSNSNSIRGEIDASFSNSQIANVIDGQTNTFWVVPILLSSIRNSGVPLEISFSLGASQDINYIEIQPASLYPMVLTQVDYLDTTNTRQTLLTPNLLLTGNKTLNFSRINTNTLILRFRQDNYEEIQFTQRNGPTNWNYAVLNENPTGIDVPAISDDLKQVLTSNFIISDIYGVSTSSLPMEKFYEYILGFDNIAVGFEEYNTRGFYVATAKKVDNPGQAALQVIENRPLQVAGSLDTAVESFTYPARTLDEDSYFYHGVVEYWLKVQSFSSDNLLIASDTLPLLPLNAERVYHEQLIFKVAEAPSVIPNLGQLVFFALADSTDVLVYRNGTLLSYGFDWEFISSSDVSGLTVDTPGAGSPMKQGIRILTGVGNLDIFTVSYTPLVSNTRVIPADTALQKVVDLTGDQDIRVVADNVIVFNSTRLSIPVAYANFYLSIIMRRNSAEDYLSPSVEEYMLTTGSINSQKFTGV